MNVPPTSLISTFYSNSPNPSVASSSTHESSRTQDDDRLVSSSTDLVAMQATLTTSDADSINAFTDAISAGIDCLPRDIFAPFDLPETTKPNDIVIGVLLPPDTSSVSGQYRVVGTMGQLVGDILIGAAPWTEVDYRQWVCVKKGQNPVTFKPAREVVDKAVAWVRGTLPEDRGRATAKLIADKIRSVGAQPLVRAHARGHTANLTSLIKDPDATGITPRMREALRQVCLQPVGNDRFHEGGSKIFAYVVRIYMAFHDVGRTDSLFVPGMTIVTAGDRNEESGKGKTAVLYCTGMDSPFRTTTLRAIENSLARFAQTPKVVALDGFPDATSSLEEMLPAYLPLLFPGFRPSSSSDRLNAELVPCDGDLFEAMTRNAAEVIARHADDPTAPNFASEVVTRRMWREWFGNPSDAPEYAPGATISPYSP